MQAAKGVPLLASVCQWQPTVRLFLSISSLDTTCGQQLLGSLLDVNMRGLLSWTPCRACLLYRSYRRGMAGRGFSDIADIALATTMPTSRLGPTDILEVVFEHPGAGAKAFKLVPNIKRMLLLSASQHLLNAETR